MSTTESSSGASAAAPPPTVYRTQVQTAPNGPWQSGLDLSLGINWGPSLSIPQPIVHLATQDVSQYATLSVDTNRRLIIDIDLESVSALICATVPPLYVNVKANLSADGATFSGRISQVCSGAVAYRWQGTCSDAGAQWLVSMLRWTTAREALRAEASATMGRCLDH